MVSIIHSFREVFTERFSLLKIVCFVIPLYYLFLLYEQGPKGLCLFHTILYPTLFFLVGFIIKITNNIANERIVTMPALNPILISISAFKGFVGIGPLSFALVLISIHLSSLINSGTSVDMVLKSIIWLVCLSIILASFLLFCERESIADAYRVMLLIKNTGIVAFALIIFLLQTTVINLVTFGVIGYTLFIIFGASRIFDLFIIFAIVFNLAASANYFGHAYCEGLGYRSNYD